MNHFIDVYVFSDHAVDREMPFDMAPTIIAINLLDSCNGFNGFVHVAH